jgi:chromate transporter
MMSNLLAVIYSFSKIGVISLGGGNSMLKLLEYEAVTYRHWIGKEEFVNMLGSSFLFPGLTAVKLAALIGYKAAGLSGLLLAVVSLNIPGLLLATLGYSWLSQHEGETTRKLMVAIQYGAAVLLATATFSIIQSVVAIHFSIPITLCCLAFFAALVFWNISPFWGFLVFIGFCFILAS